MSNVTKKEIKMKFDSEGMLSTISELTSGVHHAILSLVENSIEHGHAKEINVEIIGDGFEKKIIVYDNGDGFCQYQKIICRGKRSRKGASYGLGITTPTSYFNLMNISSTDKSGKYFDLKNLGSDQKITVKTGTSKKSKSGTRIECLYPKKSYINADINEHDIIRDLSVACIRELISGTKINVTFNKKKHSLKPWHGIKDHYFKIENHPISKDIQIFDKEIDFSESVEGLRGRVGTCFLSARPSVFSSTNDYYIMYGNTILSSGDVAKSFFKPNSNHHNYSMYIFLDVCDKNMDLIMPNRTGIKNHDKEIKKWMKDVHNTLRKIVRTRIENGYSNEFETMKEVKYLTIRNNIVNTKLSFINTLIKHSKDAKKEEYKKYLKSIEMSLDSDKKLLKYCAEYNKLLFKERR